MISANFGQFGLFLAIFGYPGCLNIYPSVGRLMAPNARTLSVINDTSFIEAVMLSIIISKNWTTSLVLKLIKTILDYSKYIKTTSYQLLKESVSARRRKINKINNWAPPDLPYNLHLTSFYIRCFRVEKHRMTRGRTSTCTGGGGAPRRRKSADTPTFSPQVVKNTALLRLP